MEELDEEMTKEANEILEFYKDLMENSRNFLRYHLSDEIVLDWFGQTVNSERKVMTFLKSKVQTIKHYFSEVKPVSQIGFRDTHRIKDPKIVKKVLTSSHDSPGRLTRSRTPKNPLENITEASTSTISSSDDSKHNSFSSPAKKMKPSFTDSLEEEILEGENDDQPGQLKYFIAEGYIEFHRPSTKKFQPETKWKRPCKLNIAYSSSAKKISEDCTFYLIIYEGNVKCRRNLLKEFETEEPEN